MRNTSGELFFSKAELATLVVVSKDSPFFFWKTKGVVCSLRPAFFTLRVERSFRCGESAPAHHSAATGALCWRVLGILLDSWSFVQSL